MGKKLFTPGGLISTALIVVVLATLAVGRHQLLALLAVMLVEFYVWWRRPHSSIALAADTYTTWLPSLAAVILVALSPQFMSQVLIIGALVVVRMVAHFDGWRRLPGVAALVMQFISLAAIFSAAQVWRWPAALVMLGALATAWLVARGFLIATGDSQVLLLAGVWALVVAELAWILSWWMIAYLSPGAFLIIPQAALLVTGLAYALGGIYRLHRTSQLSRSRLIEYLLVASVLLLVILLGTRWNGTS